MALAATQLMTAAEFAELELDARVELIAGEVIEMPVPGMRHAVVGKNCLLALELWNRANGQTWVVGMEAGVITERDPDTVRGPDIMAISRARLPEGAVPTGFLSVVPELCVEVLSPNDRWKDVIAKVHEYLTAGALELWLIDPEERLVYLYRPDDPPLTLKVGDTLSSKCLAGFQTPVAAVFQDLPE